MNTRLMNTRLALAGLSITLLSTTALAAPAKTHPVKAAPKAVKTSAFYECSQCHMKVSAAIAKKDHYKDLMDGGTLVPVKAAPK